MKTYSILYPHPYEAKVGDRTEQRTRYINIGRAFPLDGKDGFSLDIALMPPAVPGGQRLILMADESREERERKSEPPAKGASSSTSKTNGGRR